MKRIPNLLSLIAVTGILFISGSSFVFAETIDLVAGSGGWDFGRSTGSYSYSAWGYTPGASHNVCSAKVYVTAQGVPTDSVTLSIYLATTTNGYAGTYPHGTFVRSADSSYQFRGGPNYYTYTFSPCIILVGANDYEFVLSRTGSLSNSTYYTAATGISAPQQTGTGKWSSVQKIEGSTVQVRSQSFVNEITLSGTENYGVAAPSTTPSFSSSILTQLSNVTESNASTTLATGSAGFNAFAGLTNYFQTRVPFGYIWDIRDLFVAAPTTTSDFGTVRFDFTSTNISTNTRAYLPGNLAVFSTSTVTSLLSPSILAAFNSLISASIFVGWLVYAFYRIKAQAPTA